MKARHKLAGPVAALIMAFLGLAGRGQEKTAWTKDEIASLKVCEGIIRLFKQYPHEIWPGFSLAERPFLFYLPGKWALLFNPPAKAEDFTDYPAGWPDLGTKAVYHEGQYKDLIGQLAFDLPIGESKAVAVGRPADIPDAMGNPEAALFGYIVHEAFHQFQNDTFGEIPWEREERYPILDVNNTALAYLEMQLLSAAVEASCSGKKGEAQELIKKFIAVRNYRWKQASPFVSRFEQGLEIREGTASYVEKKSLGLVSRLRYRSALAGLTSALDEDLRAISENELYQKDFKNRMTDHSVAPEDMFRNRIYPVGSSLGFLSDLWGPEWKDELQRSVGNFTFEKYLAEKMGLDPNEYPHLLEEAKKEYDFEKTVASTGTLAQKYEDGFRKDLAAFNSQVGVRLEIRFAYRSISRSRNSLGKTWIVDQGQKSLCRLYRVYTLKNESLLFQLQDAGVYEENDWDNKIKKVVAFIPDITSLLVDDAAVSWPENARRPFKKIELQGKGLKFVCSLPGQIIITPAEAAIDLITQEERIP